MALNLPTYGGGLEAYALHGDPLVPRAPRVPLTRTAFAAAHVVSDPSVSYTHLTLPTKRIV